MHTQNHLLGIAGPAQVFWEANALVPEVYKLHYVALSSTITTAQGLQVTNLTPLEEVQPGKNDIIIIPGVALNSYLIENDLTKPSDEAHWFRTQYARGVRFFSIGSGTLILAKSGILDGKYCTSHWKCTKYIKEGYPRIKFIESKIFIKDQNIISSAGMSSNIDTTLAIVEEDHGPLFTARLALELLVYMRRYGDENQQSIYLDYKTHFDPLIHKVQNIISANLSKNHTNAALAEMTNTSERNLTRTFKKTLGITITEYKNKLRMELAGHLLHNKGLTLSQIAAECGFSDPRQLQRVWRRYKDEKLRTLVVDEN